MIRTGRGMLNSTKTLEDGPLGEGRMTRRRESGGGDDAKPFGGAGQETRTKLGLPPQRRRPVVETPEPEAGATLWLTLLAGFEVQALGFAFLRAPFYAQPGQVAELNDPRDDVGGDSELVVEDGDLGCGLVHRFRCPGSSLLFRP